MLIVERWGVGVGSGVHDACLKDVMVERDEVKRERMRPAQIKVLS